RRFFPLWILLGVSGGRKSCDNGPACPITCSACAASSRSFCLVFSRTVHAPRRIASLTLIMACVGGSGLPAPQVQGAEQPQTLYHLENDPGETTDVAASHPEVVLALLEVAQQARQTLGDSLSGVEGSQVRPSGRSDRVQ